MVLHRLVAVGADGGRHDQPHLVGVDPAPISSAIRVRNCSGLRARRRRKTVPRPDPAATPASGADAARRRCPRVGPSRCGVAGVARRPQRSPRSSSTRPGRGRLSAGVFDVAQRRAAQPERRSRAVWMAAANPRSPVSALRLRAHDAQHHEAAVLALQPRDQPGPQKRRLAAARTGPAPRTATCAPTPGQQTKPHRAQLIQPTHDRGVAAEKHPGVDVLERLPPAIRRPLRIRLWAATRSSPARSRCPRSPCAADRAPRC